MKRTLGPIVLLIAAMLFFATFGRGNAPHAPFVVLGEDVVLTTQTCVEIPAPAEGHDGGSLLQGLPGQTTVVQWGVQLPDGSIQYDTINVRDENPGARNAADFAFAACNPRQFLDRLIDKYGHNVRFAGAAPTP